MVRSSISNFDGNKKQKNLRRFASNIDGPPKPIIQDGFIAVPTSPGLGFSLNEEAVKAHLVPEDRGFFEPAPQWDTDISWGRLWS